VLNLNVSIVGSGISGASISRMLSDRCNVQILEKGSTPGGLIKCERVDNILFHKVGGHVFNSKNDFVLKWFWSIFNKEEFLSAKRNAKVLLNGQIIGYPIENYIFELPKSDGVRIFQDLISILKNSNNVSTSKLNFKEYLISAFGIELFKLYFEPYNSKIWQMDLDKIPLDWLDGKLPMPNIDEIFISNLLRQEETKMVHSHFFYPKLNGSQFIIDKLLNNIPIKLNYEVNSIKIINKKLIINNEFNSDVIVYTGDIRRLHDILEIDDSELSCALLNLKNLKSNGTTNILCESDANDLSWLYLPDKTIDAHRIIYTGNFSDTNNSGNGRLSCVVEFSGKHIPENLFSQLKELPGNLDPISSNYEPNSYVIQDESTRVNINAIKILLKKYNIFLLGRFAEWEYFNMDKCIESAFLIANEVEDI